MRLAHLDHPLAIAMWDFSWLERRWPGGGYEDWDAALDGLVERGYDAVRIDAFPHLLAEGPDRAWELVPVWTEHDWGAPTPVEVRVLPALTEFLAACDRRGLKVALSSWFREDREDARMRIRTPTDLARVWTRTLEAVEAAGLRHTLLFLDLGNEFALPWYIPFVHPEGAAAPVTSRRSPELAGWMRESVAALRHAAGDLDLCFSFATELDPAGQDVSMFDLLELHLWMTHPEVSEFYQAIGYDLDASGMDPGGYDILARFAEPTYRGAEGYWKGKLEAAVERAAGWSRQSGLPLVTTESWAIVNYKDEPRLDWGWVKELCAHGVGAALRTGRWAALCTSNFCGPQFRGMWADVAWHRELTTAIHAAGLPTVAHNPGDRSTRAAREGRTGPT